MPRKYKTEKNNKIKQSNAFAKPKMEITDEVICMSCKNPSGWTNDVLSFIGKRQDLKCKKCKRVCITII